MSRSTHLVRASSLISSIRSGLLLGAVSIMSSIDLTRADSDSLQALTIVIPEGVAAVYANTAAGHDHDEHGHHEGEHSHGSAHDNASWIGMALLAGFLLM